ncbi:hypothetical protein ACLB1N_03580 [Escherichia coli]
MRRWLPFDLCNADVAIGNLLIHEGAPCIAQQHAAKVFDANERLLHYKWHFIF